MQAVFPKVGEQESELAELLRPDLLEDGNLPENRVVYSGLSWNRYLAVDKALGDERSGPHLYYLNGELEIMTVSNAHEGINHVVQFFVEEYCCRQDIDITPRGMATIRLECIAGAEPDASWCVQSEKKYPDIVFEVALTSGGIRKLDVYHRLGIPEVWIWRKGALSFYQLRDDASGYERRDSSSLVPGLDLPLLYRCMAMENWSLARKAVRLGLALEPPAVNL